MSRPSRLDQEVLELTMQFVALVDAGVCLAEARRQLEIPKSTYRDWMRWGSFEREDGEPPKEPFRTFARAVNAALARFEAKLVGEILDQGRDARWATSGKEQRAKPAKKGERGAVIVPAHKAGDIILNPKGYVGRRGDWEAYAWILERRFPKRWRKTDGVEAKVSLTVDRELRAMLAALKVTLDPETYGRVLEVLGAEGGGDRAGGAPQDPGRSEAARGGRTAKKEP